MSGENYTTSFLVNKSPAECFAAINRVQEWWSTDFTGASAKTGDEFSVRFGDVHYSRHKLTELIPDQRILWLVTDSAIDFAADKNEWTGTTTSFEISEREGQTAVDFTHLGLVPEITCFTACSGGWNQFLHQSLKPYIETGIGRPFLI